MQKWYVIKENLLLKGQKGQGQNVLKANTHSMLSTIFWFILINTSSRKNNFQDFKALYIYNYSHENNKSLILYNVLFLNNCLKRHKEILHFIHNACN